MEQKSARHDGRKRGMTITLEIGKTVCIGVKSQVAVAVTALNASCDEMPFVVKLVEKVRQIAEEKEGGAK